MTNNKPNADMVVKFGISQLGNPTPMWAKYIFRTVSFLTGIWALLPQDLLYLDDHVYGQVNRWALLSSTIIYFTIKFFGWDYDASKPDTDKP